MKLKELIKTYVNSKEKRERKIGRYHASELYNIVAGNLKTKDFFKRKDVYIVGSCNIDEGIIREDALKTRFDAQKIPHEYQPKKVLKIDEEIELAVVADFKFLDKILEVKSPTTMPNEIKPWNKHQLEAQYRAFGLPVYIGYIKERWENRCFKYEPNDIFWEKTIESLKQFHQKLKLTTQPRN